MEEKLQESASKMAEEEKQIPSCIDMPKIPYCILMKEFDVAVSAISEICDEVQGDVTITVTARGEVTATIKDGTNLFSKPQTFRLENV